MTRDDFLKLLLDAMDPEDGPVTKQQLDEVMEAFDELQAALAEIGGDK